MISFIELCHLRDALDKRFGVSLDLSDEKLDRCRREAADLAGKISGYAEEAAALFFVLCRRGPFEDFAVLVAKRILSTNNVPMSASDGKDLLLLSERVSSSGTEYDEVLRWFETRCRPQRWAR